jgi:hypothetical protein
VYLAEMCPESLLAPAGSAGRLPLHEACLNGCYYWWTKNPESIKKAAVVDGSLLIHHAVTVGFGGMQLALQAAPLRKLSNL